MRALSYSKNSPHTGRHSGHEEAPWHDRAEYQQDMGHMWLGFSQELIESYLNDAGFDAARFVMLPPAPEAKGPNLFAMSATKKERS